MKKNNTILRTLSALMLLLASTLAWSYRFEAENADGVTIYYDLINDNTEAEVVSGNNTFIISPSYFDEIINIPETVVYLGKTYRVTSIGNNAFNRCSNIISVTIPASVASIGEDAFFYCSGLTSVAVDKGNPVYDSRDNCNALIETATNTLIMGCQNTVIPEGVTSIGENAFWQCSNLTSVTIPESVTSIGNLAFSGCSGLTSVTIPKSVTSIGNLAFNGCSGLTSITVDKSNPTYDSRDNCNALIETATNTLIMGCRNTVIPEGVTNIGGAAFKNCSTLTSITIPSSVTSIDYGAFSGCSGLISITVDKGNPTYDSRDNCNALIETATNTLIMGCQNTVIPESVTNIGSAAFGNCRSLTSITIPEGVTSIGEDAFFYCSGLTSVTIPKSVTSIGNGAFQYCSSLTSVTIPEGMTRIGGETFSGCSSLISVTIPRSVTSIGLFAFSSCSSLTSVYSLVETPFNISANAVFQSIADDATLYVPQGTKSAYEAAGGWTENFSHVVEFDATSIAGTPTRQTEGDAVYDLNGTKMNVRGGGLKSLSRGIYIKNGKKVMVK